MNTRGQDETLHISDKDILDDILKQMSKGVLPWRIPWSISTVVIGSMKYLASNWPSNVRAPLVPFGIYNGILLYTHARTRNYRTNLWVSEQTVRQLKALRIPSDRYPVAIRNFDDKGNPTGKRLVYNIDQIVD